VLQAFITMPEGKAFVLASSKALGGGPLCKEALPRAQQEFSAPAFTTTTNGQIGILQAVGKIWRSYMLGAGVPSDHLSTTTKKTDSGGKFLSSG
jgi:hypothetical protein